MPLVLCKNDVEKALNFKLDMPLSAEDTDCSCGSLEDRNANVVCGGLLLRFYRGMMT